VKKSALFFVFVISTLLAGVVGASPASAAVTPHDTGTLTYTVGDTVNLDLGCQEPNITDVHFFSGVLPPGLTMDSQGLITGLPTTSGTYRLDGYSCTYNGGSNGGSSSGYFVIFQINEMTTPAPFLAAHNLNAADCSFYVGFVFPSTPDTGTVYLIIENSRGDSIRAYAGVSDHRVAGTLYGGTLTVNDLNNASDFFGLQPAITGFRDYKCGDTLNFSVGYQSGGAPVATASVNSVVVDKPAQSGGNGGGNNNPADFYTISASRSMTGNCSISVVASSSDFMYQGPYAIGILNVDNSNFMNPYAVASFDEFPEDGIVSATLSLASVTDMSANVPLTYKSIGSDDPTCIGYFRVVLVASVGPGVILNSSVFNLTPSTCNAGWLIGANNEGCSEVQRGFYTTELNSTSAIACPAGMTTATTASKSVNDCYMPIVQSIVGFKIPKVLKFKATTNLALITNTKALSTFTIAGPCTGKIGNVASKVKGKKVTTKMLKITAGQKAGKCTINLAAPASGKYLDLRQVVNIKVSKTGK